MCWAAKKRIWIVAFVILFWASDSSLAQDSCKARVVDIVDAKTIKVQFIEPDNRSHGQLSYCPSDGESGTISLLAVWSNPQIEPPSVYRERIAFMRNRLVQQVIIVPLKTHVITDKGEVMSVSVYVESPADVAFENHTSVNETLFSSGYAMLDENPFSDFKAGERYKQYKAAETEAISAQRGIWQNVNEKTYKEQKTLMVRTAEREWAGMGFYFGMQLLLAAVILWLAYLVRSNIRAVEAILALLILPIANLAPDLWLWLKSSGDPMQYTNAAKAYEAHLMIPIVAIVVCLIAFVIFSVLVAAGPADAWGAAGVGLRRSKYVWFFLIGVWATVLLFAVVYRYSQSIGWDSAFHSSYVIALGLPAGIVGQTSPSGLSVLLEKIAVLMWFGFCAAAIRPSPTLFGTFRWNLAVASACFLIVTISTTSLFAAIYFMLSFNAGNLAAPTGRMECFWLSLATLFRQNYSSLTLASWWAEFYAVTEVHVAFFLALVGFRTLWALPWASPDAQVKRRLSAGAK